MKTLGHTYQLHVMVCLPVYCLTIHQRVLLILSSGLVPYFPPLLTARPSRELSLVKLTVWKSKQNSKTEQKAGGTWRDREDYLNTYSNPASMRGWLRSKLTLRAILLLWQSRPVRLSVSLTINRRGFTPSPAQTCTPLPPWCLFLYLRDYRKRRGRGRRDSGKWVSLR